MKKNTDLGLLILRVTIGGLMLFHGVAKLSNLNGVKNRLMQAGLPELLAYGVYVTELIAPLLILIGFRVRLASVAFFFGMLTALSLAHSNDIFSISKSGGLEIELVLLFAFGAVALFFTGAGKYAVSSTHQWD